MGEPLCVYVCVCVCVFMCATRSFERSLETASRSGECARHCCEYLSGGRWPQANDLDPLHCAQRRRLVAPARPIYRNRFRAMECVSVSVVFGLFFSLFSLFLSLFSFSLSSFLSVIPLSLSLYLSLCTLYIFSFLSLSVKVHCTVYLSVSLALSSFLPSPLSLSVLSSPFSPMSNNSQTLHLSLTALLLQRHHRLCLLLDSASISLPFSFSSSLDRSSFSLSSS